MARPGQRGRRTTLLVGTELQDLEIAMEHYLNYHGGHGHTLRAKRAACEILAGYIKRTVEAPSISHVTRNVIEDCKEELLRSGKSAATVAQRLAIWKHFCKATAQLFPGFQDPSYGVTSPTSPRRSPQWLTREEFDAIRAQVEHITGYEGARALVIAHLGFSIGLRRHEISTLTMSSLNLKAGLLTNIRRKGSKFADKPLTRHAVDAIRAYLPFRERMILDRWPEFARLNERQKGLYPLIVSHWSAWPGKPESWRLSDETINRMFKKWAKDAGVEHGHSHQMRHTFGRRLWERTRDLELVMHGMDHSSPVTTMRYAGSTEEQLREAMEDD